MPLTCSSLCSRSSSQPRSLPTEWTRVLTTLTILLLLPLLGYQGLLALAAADDVAAHARHLGAAHACILPRELFAVPFPRAAELLGAVAISGVLSCQIVRFPSRPPRCAATPSCRHRQSAAAPLGTVVVVTASLAAADPDSRSSRCHCRNDSAAVSCFLSVGISSSPYLAFFMLLLLTILARLPSLLTLNSLLLPSCISTLPLSPSLEHQTTTIRRSQIKLAPVRDVRHRRADRARGLHERALPPRPLQL